MRPISRRSRWLLAVVTAIALAGCGDEATEPTDAAGSASPTATDEPTHEHGNHEKHENHSGHEDGDKDGPATATTEPADDAVDVEIDIEGGKATPAAAQVEATVGDKIALEVDSDTADELHVHSAPTEHDYAVRAADDQEFVFTVQQPGQFDIELHDAGVLVAQLVVRP